MSIEWHSPILGGNELNTVGPATENSKRKRKASSSGVLNTESRTTRQKTLATVGWVLTNEYCLVRVTVRIRFIVLIQRFHSGYAHVFLLVSAVIKVENWSCVNVDSGLRLCL